MKTALTTARDMDLLDRDRNALKYDVHPQERTRAFHQLFGAPIYDQMPDATFSHMDDQRVAFRTSFILSEAMEILEKGLGLKVGLVVDLGPEGAEFAESSDNAELHRAILAGIRYSGKRNVIEVVDGLADLNVVVNGFALELGADMRQVDQEVLASNFTKLAEDGTPIVADGSDPKWPAGKILKGPNFMEPNIAAVLGLSEA